MDLAEGALLGLSVPGDRIHIERFSVDQAVAGVEVTQPAAIAVTVILKGRKAEIDDEVAEGWVLTCQSVPTSDRVTVEYESL